VFLDENPCYRCVKETTPQEYCMVQQSDSGNNNDAILVPSTGMFNFP
jgi:hypothetical protein